MYYTIITEVDDKALPRHQRLIHNVKTEDIAKLLAVIYTGIDMDGSKEKMRLVNISSKFKKDDSGWAEYIDEYIDEERPN